MLFDKDHTVDNIAKKRSLILAGGGMRLAYQAGVLIALEEEESLNFNHVDGTSGGIFNAGMLASGLNPHEIAERWRNLDIKNFMSMRPLKKYFKPLNMMGYADADGIRDNIFQDLGIEIHKINSNKKADTTFNVCNFSDKSIESIDQTKAKEDHLIAGVSLPIVMPALKIGDQWYSDAVWIKDANLLEAVKRGAEELWLVWAIGNTDTYLPGALNQYVHMIEMSANGGLLEEYERIKLVNESIENNEEKYEQKKPIKLFVIKPELPLPLDPDLFFNKIDARSLINMGYEGAKKVLRRLPDNGVAFDKEATKMTDPGIRLNIRSEFHGTLKNKDKAIKSSFYTYMVLSDRLEGAKLSMYSSIKIQGFNHEIPCCNHSLKTIKTHNKNLLECICDFEFEGERYTLTASWALTSIIDFFLGLAFKSVHITITKKDELESIYTGKLYQEIHHRIKSFFSTNIRKQDGKPGGLKLKYRMASKLINYAI